MRIIDPQNASLPVVPREMIGAHTIDEIERVIQDLSQEYQRVPGLILTEADLKFQLMSRLSIDRLGIAQPSANSLVPDLPTRSLSRKP